MIRIEVHMRGDKTNGQENWIEFRNVRRFFAFLGYDAHDSGPLVGERQKIRAELRENGSTDWGPYKIRSVS